VTTPKQITGPTFFTWFTGKTGVRLERRKPERCHPPRNPKQHDPTRRDHALFREYYLTGSPVLNQTISYVRESTRFAGAGGVLVSARRMITVCDACLQASCWQGIFMCYESRNAGIVQMPETTLRRLGLEHPSYWKTDEEISNGPAQASAVLRSHKKGGAK
jgi:hypothetical protein